MNPQPVCKIRMGTPEILKCACTLPANARILGQLQRQQQSCFICKLARSHKLLSACLGRGPAHIRLCGEAKEGEVREESSSLCSEGTTPHSWSWAPANTLKNKPQWSTWPWALKIPWPGVSEMTSLPSFSFQNKLSTQAKLTPSLCPHTALGRLASSAHPCTPPTEQNSATHQLSPPHHPESPIVLTSAQAPGSCRKRKWGEAGSCGGGLGIVLYSATVHSLDPQGVEEGGMGQVGS